MRAAADSFGHRSNMAAAKTERKGATLAVRFSWPAFISATAILTLAFPLLTVATALWARKSMDVAFRGAPGGTIEVQFLAYWLIAGLIFAAPLGIAGFFQRHLMNRQGWSSILAFALLGGGWGTALLSAIGAAAAYKLGYSIVGTLTLAIPFAVPFGLAHGLMYRALGGVAPRA